MKKAFEDIVETQDNSYKEDCLRLSVYVPRNAFEQNHKLPVLVYFHGGAYAIGKYPLLEAPESRKTLIQVVQLLEMVPTSVSFGRLYDTSFLWSQVKV